MPLNIRVYKVLARSSTYFELATSDKESAIGAGTLACLAGIAKDLCESGSSIDFVPLHDVVCPVGLTPRRCFPLDDEERGEFWKHFEAAE